MPENQKPSRSKQVEELKERGNDCMKDGRYLEAVMEYSHALKMDSSHYQLYSNRCLAFTKLQQYYYALQDANQTIQLQPKWAKGYFRKAEIEFACQRYDDAMWSYGEAVKLSGSDDLVPYVLKSMEHAEKQKTLERSLPWIGVGVGFIVGALLMIAHYFFTNEDLLNPFMSVVILLCISTVGYIIARGYLYYKRSQMEVLLEPPVDLFPEDDPPEQESEQQCKPRTRYNKAAAWQRYKNKRKHS